jgi:hypothetical protein
VQVVRHQDVGIKAEFMPLLVASKQFRVLPVVCFVSKDMAPLVSTGDDVVEGAWNIDAGRPSHAVSPKRTPWKVKERFYRAYQWVVEIANYQGLAPFKGAACARCGTACMLISKARPVGSRGLGRAVGLGALPVPGYYRASDTPLLQE